MSIPTPALYGSGNNVEMTYAIHYSRAPWVVNLSAIPRVVGSILASGQTCDKNLCRPFLRVFFFSVFLYLLKKPTTTSWFYLFEYTISYLVGIYSSYKHSTTKNASKNRKSF